MDQDGPAPAVLRRRTRLGTPVLLLAMLFGGLALYHAVAPDIPKPFVILSSPHAVALFALAAAGCVALAVRAGRAEDRLFALEVRQARRIRRDLLASRRGEEFALRWSAAPVVVRNRLRELREEREVPPAELAEALGVTEGTLSLIEQKGYEPGLKVALLASEYLGESVEEMFRVAEGPPRPAFPNKEAERGGPGGSR